MNTLRVILISCVLTVVQNNVNFVYLTLVKEQEHGCWAKHFDVFALTEQCRGQEGGGKLVKVTGNGRSKCFCPSPQHQIKLCSDLSC